MVIMGVLVGLEVEKRAEVGGPLLAGIEGKEGRERTRTPPHAVGVAFTVRQKLYQARNPMTLGNQIHSSALWTLGKQKIYM